MLIIDNYDSFTYNIVEYVKLLGIKPIVIKNDGFEIGDINRLNFERIIISPGYGNPSNSGICMQILEKYHGKKPILGICLGHQCVAEYFGAKIIRAVEPCHGKISKIFFDKGCVLYSGIKQGFQATRYHSLIVDKDSIQLPIHINAQTIEGLVMGLQIKNSKTYGVQFHPEAILTEYGLKLLENFINL
ncbi:MAG: aminodeoxychorismate/anthranilate synthase component II [Candidatus Gastranaerophilales bacterium]|nr:aminodeoxychorismate/anthranilate synthase component II [Candidatus Gastranaerophilales bacterium]